MTKIQSYDYLMDCLEQSRFSLRFVKDLDLPLPKGKKQLLRKQMAHVEQHLTNLILNVKNFVILENK